MLLSINTHAAQTHLQIWIRMKSIKVVTAQAPVTLAKLCSKDCQYADAPYTTTLL